VINSLPTNQLLLALLPGGEVTLVTLKNRGFTKVDMTESMSLGVHHMQEELENISLGALVRCFWIKKDQSLG
jgi:hypothetical protein